MCIMRDFNSPPLCRFTSFSFFIYNFLRATRVVEPLPPSKEPADGRDQVQRVENDDYQDAENIQQIDFLS